MTTKMEATAIMLAKLYLASRGYAVEHAGEEKEQGYSTSSREGATKLSE